ncbi:MAG TPA: PQQ-binding-like beta-propeller repeat protein [Gaiellaceae bacterium]|nr:PQQ-binding-like beta-propeller repeat protein [Gaiellaceae bacterium]
MSLAVVAAPPSPYKGLAAFSDSDLDALLFFGREREIEVIKANLVAARLTLLYGPSGVGKTSLLRAGVAHELRRDDDAAVVVFSSWSGDPIDGLLAAVRREVSRLRPDVDGVAPGRSVAETFAAWTRRLGADLYLVLDQFEEYFLYHAEHEAGGPFAELAEVVRLPGLRANFLISIREDSLAQLDAFKAQIPNLFANSLRLDRLDRGAAERAILGPLERYNELVPPDESVEAEPQLVEEILDAVAVGRIQLGSSGRGGAEDGSAERGAIEAPYLQLVLERLWEVEAERGSRRLRLETLHELGGAAHIVEDHLERAMAGLSEEERDAAAAMYNHLVTPSGTKIAHRASDLAGYAAVEEVEAERVLDRLTSERIVRAGEDGAAGPRYEIFHDVLADAVLAWRTRHEAERRLQAERQEAARRHRRLLGVAGLTALAFGVLAAIAVYALTQRSSAQDNARQARAGDLVALAAAGLSTDPVRSLGLGIQASDLSQSRTVEDLLRRALVGLRTSAVLDSRKPFESIAFSADGKSLVATTGGEARIYSGDGKRLLTTLNHGGNVKAASFSPDGDRVVTAGDDGFARVWSTADGRQLRKLRHGGPVTGASFAPQGPFIATTSDDKTARIWDARTGRLLHRLTHPNAVRSASFNHDGSLIVTVANDRVARVFDVATGRLQSNLVQRGQIRAARFSPTSDLVATGGADSVARLWNGRTGAPVGDALSGHKRPVTDVSFSPQGDLVATASADGTARVWKTDGTGLVAILPGHAGFVERVDFSPDGKTIVTASRDRMARLFGADSGTLFATLAGHAEAVNDVRFTSGGGSVASASSDGTVRFWNAHTYPELKLLGQHATPVAAVSFAGGGDQVLSIGERSPLRGWKLTGGSAFAKALQGAGAPLTAAFSGDGRVLATVDEGGALKIWDVASGRLVRTLIRPGAPTALALTEDGKTVVAGTADGTVRSLSVSDGDVERTIHTEPNVTVVAISPDGRRILAAGDDYVARIWDAKTGKRPRALEPHEKALTSASFSPDGRFVVTTSIDQNARLSDAESGKQIWLLSHASTVNAADFSADSRWVVIAGPRVAGIVNAESGERILRIKGRDDQMTAAAFSPHGYRIATGGKRGSVETYDCRVCGGMGQLVKLAERRLARLRATP